MVIRTASRALRWRHVREDREASVVWLDRWENGDLMNLAPPRKVRRGPKRPPAARARPILSPAPLLFISLPHDHYCSFLFRHMTTL